MTIALKRRLAEGEVITMLNPNHIAPTLAEKLTQGGADLVFIDLEHGTFGYDQLQLMSKCARLGGGYVVARPQNQDRSVLMRTLHCGADGLMVPLVNTAEEAEQVVDAVQYAFPDDYAEKLVIVMIETVEAVRNLDQILAVPGIDVFFVGPGDLCQTMGYSNRVPPGGRRPRPVLEVVDQALLKIRAAGKHAGTLVLKADIAHYAALGVQLLYYHVDPLLNEALATMREITAKARN